MTKTKLPCDLTHKTLELYFKDPLEFEAKHVYGLKSKAPFKRFVKRLNEKTEETQYEEGVFWKYQRQRILETLGITPLNETITVPFWVNRTLTERIDYLHEKTLVCFTTSTPPEKSAMTDLTSLKLSLCAYCVEQHYGIELETLQFWHLKGYQDIIEKVSYPRSVMVEVLELLKTHLEIT